MLRPWLLVGVSTAALLLGFVGLPSATASYVVLAMTLLVGCVLASKLDRLPLFFLALYLCIGALPVSTYRGELGGATMAEYVALVAAIQLAIAVVELASKQSGPKSFQPLPWSKRHATIMWAICGVSFVALAKITVQHGFVFLHQFDRFEISGYDSYLVKASGYVVLYLAASRGFEWTWKGLAALTLPVLPTLLIGSRGGVVILYLGVMSIVFARVISGETGLRITRQALRRSAIALALVGYAVVTIGFMLRRGQSGVYMTASELHDAYFDTPKVISYLIMPIHLALRETIGLTNFILERGISNEALGYPLVLADFYTLLPGEQMSAGSALASSVGAVAAGGLTPGMLGGLRLDYSLLATCAVGFSVSAFLAVLSQKAMSRGVWCAFWALTLIQFLQFFHRGFAKPEYLFAYAVLAIVWITPRLRIRI